MPQADKKKRVETSSKAEETRAALAAKREIQRERKARQTTYLIVGLVFVVILTIFGVFYYQNYVAPFRQIVITVDDTTIRMGYFLERARVSGSGGIAVLQNLTNEYLIKVGAARYGIAVTPQDIDRELRRSAAGSDNVTITDAEFKEWYRQLLNDSKVSDGRYREMVGSSLRAGRLQEYIALGIPATLEHAHVYGIFVLSFDEAAKVKVRIEAGEDFGKVAREVSIDQATREKDGELDWIPRGIMIFNMDPFLLEAGEVSDPLAIAEDPNTPPSTYYVLRVSERANRDVRPEFLPELRNRVFQDWLNQETEQHEIKWNYNSTIDAWVNWQLSKGKSSSSSSGS
jgi:hypothetical protein